jgi:hypothetical protein
MPLLPPAFFGSRYHPSDPYEMVHVLKRVMRRPKAADHPPPQNEEKTMERFDPSTIKKPPKRCAGPVEYINIGKKLEEVCSKDADGFAQYIDGWNDDRVALFLDPTGSKISPSSVMTTRLRVYGRERRGNGMEPSNKKVDGLLLRLEINERRVFYLANLLGVQFPPELMEPDA